MKRSMMMVLAITLLMTLGLGGNSFAGNGNMRSDGTAAAIQNGNADNPRGVLKEQFRHCARWHHRPVLNRLFHCMQDLNLSDETRQAVRDLLAAYKESAAARREAYNQARIAYWEALTAPVLDEAALAAAEDAMLALINEGMNAKFDLAYAIRGLLTDEQIAQLSTCFDFSVDDDQDDEPAGDLEND
ncbi:MAG: Spy/CpxP family protein refolding chaperone [Thermodesulfobacteriota bacterium]